MRRLATAEQKRPPLLGESLEADRPTAAGAPSATTPSATLTGKVGRGQRFLDPIANRRLTESSLLSGVQLVEPHTRQGRELVSREPSARLSEH